MDLPFMTGFSVVFWCPAGYWCHDRRRVPIIHVSTADMHLVLHECLIKETWVACFIVVIYSFQIWFYKHIKHQPSYLLGVRLARRFQGKPKQENAPGTPSTSRKMLPWNVASKESTARKPPSDALLIRNHGKEAVWNSRGSSQVEL